MANEMRYMRKALKTTTDSIEKMQIEPSRIETLKQKEKRKLKKEFGL